LKAIPSIPWLSEPIESVVADRTGGQTKILRSDYEKTGAFPVIDQGKEFSNGFTNDESKLYRGKLPLVLFGDHTRGIKFVDQPFALGADGVKALEPKSILAAKFLYYFLLKSPIEARGYSRHFKYLKEKSIPLPPLPEQDRIVEILDQADTLRQQRRQADALSQRILPALFQEMFGDLPIDEKRLGDHLSFMTSGSRGWAEHYAEAGALFIRIQNVGKITLSLEDCAFVVPPKNKEAQRTKVLPRDVLLSITADLGRTSVIPDGFGDGYINQHLAILRSSSLNPYFLAAFLESHEGKRQIGGLNRAAVKAGLNFSDIRSVKVPFAPLDKQKAFEERVLSFHSTQSKSSTTSATLETLFQTLLHRAFDGSLTAKWREGHTKEVLQEMERNANKLA
jgi:type I restriction enzyme S subunit